jgi:ribose/xylose/arabinose/galactoside ABC-type transport system permease subunit
MSSTSVAKEEARAVDRSRRVLRLQEYALVLVVVALLVIGTVLRPGSFLTSANLLTIITSASVVGVLAIAMTFVIATGGIDLSVGSIVAAAAIAGGLVARADWVPETLGSTGFIVAALLFGLLLGTVNALAVTWGRVVPFIATLAMLTVARGLALRMSGQAPISTSSLDVVRYLGTGRIAGLPVSMLVFLAVTAAGWFLLNRTAYGRHVVATGGNAEAARIAGIRVSRIRFSVYVMTGLCAGISAVLLAGRLASASPVAGGAYELDAIAAVVIGGTSLSGGKSTVTGTFLGVLTFALIFNLLNLLNLPAELQQIVKGLIILAAVIAQRQRQ